MSDARAWLPTICPTCHTQATEWLPANKGPGPVPFRCDSCLVAVADGDPDYALEILRCLAAARRGTPPWLEP